MAGGCKSVYGKVYSMNWEHGSMLKQMKTPTTTQIFLRQTSSGNIGLTELKYDFFLLQDFSVYNLQYILRLPKKGI